MGRHRKMGELKRAAQDLGVQSTHLIQQGWKTASPGRVQRTLEEQPQWLLDAREYMHAKQLRREEKRRSPSGIAESLAVQVRAVRERGITFEDVPELLENPPEWLLAERERLRAHRKKMQARRRRREESQERELEEAFERAKLVAVAAEFQCRDEDVQRFAAALFSGWPGKASAIVSLSNGWSTSVRQQGGGRGFDVENPPVLMCVIASLRDGQTLGVTARLFEDEVYEVREYNGRQVPIPYKTVCGWFTSDGRMHPLAEPDMFEAFCTDRRTGEPIAPEGGVRFADAWEVAFE